MKDRQLKLHIRPIEDHDFPQVLAVVNAVEAPWQSTEEELRREDGDIVSAGGVCRHLVALSGDDGAILGHAALRGGAPASGPPSLSVEVRVRPERWGHGIGTALWRRIEDDADRLSPTELTAWVRECYPAAVAFAEKAGFKKLRSSSPWYLRIEDADIAALEAAARRAEENGTTVTTLEDERRNGPDVLHALHALRRQIDRDVPGTPSEYAITFDAFLNEIHGPGLLPDGFFIAKSGDDYVGMTSLMTHGTEPQALNQTTTGVRSDSRRKGIALALKARGVMFARDKGYTTIHTYMDGTNAPMIELNRRVGFQRGAGVAFMVRARSRDLWDS